jgi:hypothetical protein
MLFANIAYANDTVNALLKKTYPEYAIKDPNILSADLKSTFNKDIKTPTTVVADFDGNNLDDYAFILRSNKNTEEIFIVCLQISNKNYRIIEILRDNYVFDYIEIVKPNTFVEPTLAVETHANPITLKNHAINAVNYGKSSAVYFWDNNTKSFNVIWTSD